MNLSEVIIRLALGLPIAGLSIYAGSFALRPLDHFVLGLSAVGILLGGVIIDADPLITAIRQLIAEAKDAKSLKD